MNHWLNNSTKNLLPLSKAPEFSEALREWFFTGDVDDYEGEDAEIICELCEHHDLVHHYHIKNSITGNSLLVGSSCILKFQQIEVRDKSGRPILDPTLRKSALDAALRAQVIENALEPLRKLWKKHRQNRYEIEFMAQEVKRDLGVEPQDLVDVLVQLDSYQIAYSTRSYKVTLRSDSARTQITFMSKEDFHRIKPALSKSQLVRARELRNEA